MAGSTGVFDDIVGGTPSGGGTGMFDDIVPQQKTSAAKDIALSGATGAVHGAENFAGMFGDASNLLAKGSKIAGDYVGGLFGAEPSPEISKHGLPLPTSEEVRNTVEGVTGPMHAPETTAGKYAESVGEVLGNPGTYFGPGGWLAKTLQGAASGVGAEAAGQLTGDNPYARFAGSVIGGPLAGRALNPQVGGAAQRALMARGTEMTPGQLLGENAARLEDIAAGTPILGSFIRNARNRSVESFNRSVGNQALEPIGERLANRTPAGHEMVQEVEDKLDGAYNNLVPNLHFVPDGQWAQDMANITANARRTMPTAHADLLENIIDQRLGPNRWVQQINPQGTQPSQFWGIQGPTFKNIESEINHLSRTYGRSMDGAQQLLGDSLGDVLRAMRSNLERQNPAYADELRRINRGWAMYSRIRTAAANRVSSEGVFSPGDLLSSIKRGDSSVGKGMFAKGDALMQRFATAAQHVLPAKLANSGTPERLMVLGLPGMIKDAIANPVKAAAGIAGGAALAGAYSPLGSRAINYLARPTAGFRGQYAAAGRGPGLAKTLLTTPYGDNESPYWSGGRVGKDDGGALSDQEGAMMPETSNPFVDRTKQAAPSPPAKSPLAGLSFLRAGKAVNDAIDSTINTLAYPEEAVSGFLGQAASLPKRAIDASAQDVQHLGEAGYEPQSVGPAVETAMNMIGGPAEEGTLRTGLGIRAHGASLNKLEQFQRLEKKGASPELNYGMSGWYRGADNKPRFWLSDEGANLTDKAMASEGHAEVPAMVWDNGKPGSGFDPGVEPHWRDPTLGDIWNHPRLYDAYPFLKNLPVKRELNPEWGGHFAPDENAIYVGNNPDPKAFEDTLHHEVVHAIQQHEGFSPGTNSGAMQPSELPGYESKLSKMEQDVKKKAEDAGVNHDLAWVVSNMGKEDIDEHIKPILDKVQGAGLVDKYRDLSKAKNAIQTLKDQAYQRYMHTHGESEARDAPFIRRNPGAVPPGRIPLHVNPELTPGRDIETLRAFGGRIPNPYAHA